MNAPVVTRRKVTLGMSAGALAAIARPAFAQAPVPMPGERVVGSADAPVTVIEYHSLTCGNCAGFHMQIFPKDQGGVHRQGPGQVRAAGFSARRRGRRGRDPRPLRRPGQISSRDFEPLPRQGAMGTCQGAARLPATDGSLPWGAPARYEACRADKDFVGAIMKMAFEGQQQYAIKGTPSFIIGGKLYGGILTFERFSEIVRPLLPPASRG